MPTGKRKTKRYFQIIHPSQIENVRESLEILNEHNGLCPHKTVKQIIETNDFEFEALLEAEEEKYTRIRWLYGPHKIE